MIAPHPFRPRDSTPSGRISANLAPPHHTTRTPSPAHPRRAHRRRLSAAGLSVCLTPDCPRAPGAGRRGMCLRCWRLTSRAYPPPPPLHAPVPFLVRQAIARALAQPPAST